MVWGAWKSLVAPYFIEVEEAAEGGQYGRDCSTGGRVGSGGGWVVEGLMSRVSRLFHLFHLSRYGESGQGGRGDKRT